MNIKHNTNDELFYKWNFGTINIRTGDEKSEGARIYMVAKQVAEAKLLVCSLQEVRYRNNGKQIINLDTGESFMFYWSGPKKRRDNGVGIMIRQCKEVSFDDPDVVDARMIAMNIKVNGYAIRLVNAYAPTNCDSSESSKDTFYRLLRKSTKKQFKQQKLIVNGDLNATTELSTKQCYYNGKCLIEDSLCNDNGQRLKHFCQEKLLCMSQSFYDHPIENRYTWYSGNGITKKVLDYILVEAYTQQYMEKCEVTNIDFESDHRLLLAEMKTPTTKKARWQGKKAKKKEPRVNPKDLDNAETKRKYIQIVNSELSKTQELDGTDGIGSNLVQCLATAAKESIKVTKKQCTNNELWKNDALMNKLLVERKPLTRNSFDYKRITKEIKTRVNQLRNEKLANEATKINEYATQKEVEQLYKSFKDENSSFKAPSTTKRCEPHKLKEFFRKHFQSAGAGAEPIELDQLPDTIKKLQEIPTLNMRSGPPDKEELLKVIRKIKNSNSASDTPITFIKHALNSNEFTSELLRLYETAWVTKAIPKEWGHSKLITIWKGPGKGKQEDPSTYRGLQVGSSFCKIMVSVIIGRLRDWYDKQLLDQQQGFRFARGTADGIYIAKRTQQISENMKKKVYVIFVDLSAAFDHVDRGWMFKSIKNRFKNGANTELIQLLENLYQYTTTALAETPEDKFEVNTGVRQGGPESPLLYNLYMDYIMRIYLGKCHTNGINFLKLKYNIPSSASNSGRVTKGTYELDWTGYADDLMITFDDLASLQKGITILNELFKQYRLKINITKTKTMIFNQQLDNEEYPTTVASLNGKSLENVVIYSYLGCDIKYNESSTGDTELNLRTDAATNKFYSISKNLLNQKIYLKTRVLMINSLVRSRLTYASQTWNCTKSQLTKLNATYMGYLRRLVKGGFDRKDGGWSFKYSNTQLLRICNTGDLCDFIKSQQLKYVVNILKRSDGSITKRLLFNDDKITRRGRPQVTLISSVLKAERCSLTKLIENNV